MPPKRRRRGGGDKPSGSAPWMQTYSDLVTLLLAFFILLFAFSNLDIQRFRAVMSAFQASVGVMDGGRTMSSQQAIAQGSLDLDTTIEGTPQETREMQQVLAELQDFVEREELEESLEIIFQERGVVIRFADQVLFDLGRANLLPEALTSLDQVASVLDQVPNHVRVEGHTDDLPISTEQFPSNWELSTARATTVVRYLIERQELPPDRLSAAGYGEYRPIMPNDSVENRAQNRRVDIVLLRADLEGNEPG